MQLTDEEKNAIATLRVSNAFKVVQSIFTRRLEFCKTNLVRAKSDVYLVYQGKAQELEEIITFLR